MEAVYLLWDNRLERECTLKEMLPLSEDPSEMKEFREHPALHVTFVPIS
ncbi:MAG: hypothetical protein AB2L14_18050 [Candidatus Xenobiia bacterium LiM19]